MTTVLFCTCAAAATAADVADVDDVDDDVALFSRPPGTEGYADGRPLPVELPATVAMGCADGDGASKSSGAEVAPNASCIGAGFYNTFFFRNDQVGVLCAGSNAAGQCGSAAATSERFEKARFEWF